MKKSILAKTLALAALLVALIGGTASAGQAPDPQFAPAKNYENPGSGQPQVLAKGDFDENGIVDLVMAVADSPDDDVSLFRGNRNGTFDEPPKQFDVAQDASFVIASDFDKDGHLDLAVSDIGKPFSPGSVVILLGKGDGTFGEPESFPSGGNFPVGLADSDFDKDGDRDLAVANSNSSNIQVLVNDGNGAFSTGQTITTAPGPLSLAQGDFDRDGDKDLVVTNAEANAVTLLENEEGVFVPGQPVTVGFDPQGIVAGYLNDDRKLDFATANAESNNVSVRLGNGDGTFSSAGEFPSGGVGPTSLAEADFNQDGKNDLAVTNIGEGGPNTGDNVGVLPGKGDGAFRATETFDAGTGPGGIAAGKFNRNKKIDIATANVFSNDLSVLINTTKKK